MVKNGNLIRVFELSIRVFEVWEKNREEEFFKYVVCCNDRVGLICLIFLLLFFVYVMDCVFWGEGGILVLIFYKCYKSYVMVCFF